MLNKKFTKENLISAFPVEVINKSEKVLVENKFKNWWGGECVEMVEEIKEVKGQIHISKLEEAVEKFISENSQIKYSLAQQNYSIKLINKLASGYVGYARPNLEAIFHLVGGFLNNTNEVNHSSDKVRNVYISLTTKPKARKGIYNGTGKTQIAEGIKESDEVRGVMTIIKKTYDK